MSIEKRQKRIGDVEVRHISCYCMKCVLYHSYILTEKERFLKKRKNVDRAKERVDGEMFDVRRRS